MTDVMISFDMTHSGSSVDLIPTAEDEAGLGIIHPGVQKKDKKEERQACSNK